MMPGTFPKFRATFVAPTLRLPCARMSAPATNFTTRKLNGIDPIRYAATMRMTEAPAPCGGYCRAADASRSTAARNVGGLSAGYR